VKIITDSQILILDEQVPVHDMPIVAPFPSSAKWFPVLKTRLRGVLSFKELWLNFSVDKLPLA
jgi:hypothetical protein